MSTDKEAALPIEDFLGINRNVDREDLAPQQLYATQNLWEKHLGTLETRGHSENIIEPENLPSNIVGLDRNFKIYRACGESTRFAAIQCTPDVQQLSNLVTGVSISFVDSVSGWWNKEFTFGAGYDSSTFDMKHPYVLLRFVGYGVDYWYKVDSTTISGYTAGNAQKLRVTISAVNDLTKNITGIEVYASVKCGNTETVATITNTSNYNEQTMWVGYIDFITYPPSEGGTFDFNNCPYGYNSTTAADTVIHDTERTFSATAYKTGQYSQTGYFRGGKTYYVAVLPQYMKCSANPNSRCCYRNKTVNVFGGDIVAVTIPGGPDDTGYIRVTNVAPNTVAAIIAIGETPQTLQPVALGNDLNTAYSKDIFLPPKHSPACVDFLYTADGIATLQFRGSDFSHKDMFMGINDDGTVFPIFATRLHNEANYWDQCLDWMGDTTFAAHIQGYIYMTTYFMDQVQQLGNGDKYEYVQWDNYALCVSSHNPITDVIDGLSVGALNHRTNNNYVIIDGAVAAHVIEDYQSPQITLPSARYIAKFDSSICIGGGSPVTDPLAAASILDPTKTIYFSRALNPFDFTIAGASSTTHQTLAVDDDGENINGFGIYTNSTDTSGVNSQLITSKKNCFWTLNAWPETTSGALGDFNLRILSKKAGSVGLRTFVNTPIGLIAAAHDNVYLLRETGEPTPIGQNIIDILRGANMDNASACYHDKHYKLSFYHPDYPGNVGHNNVEFWLNINKMIEGKGREDWVGPMVGRSVYTSFVEDREGDGYANEIARDRLCIDQENLRIYKADVELSETDEAAYDFGEDVYSIFESKDLEVSQQDNNWNKLLKRTYWKIRTNRTQGDPLVFTEETYLDGVLAESKTSSAYGISGVDFSKQPLKVNTVFPATRQRGRTIRKIFSTPWRVGIAGFQINYTVERRRM